MLDFRNVNTWVPVEISSIDANNNPTIQKALIVLLELSYVLILAFGHCAPDHVSLHVWLHEIVTKLSTVTKPQ